MIPYMHSKEEFQFYRVFLNVLKSAQVFNKNLIKIYFIKI